MLGNLTLKFGLGFSTLELVFSRFSSSSLHLGSPHHLWMVLNLHVSSNLEYMSWDNSKGRGREDIKARFFLPCRESFKILAYLIMSDIWNKFYFVLCFVCVSCGWVSFVLCWWINWSYSGRECLITFVNLPKGYKAISLPNKYNLWIYKRSCFVFNS